MSRGFIKEGDQEAIPMVPLRAYLPEGVPNFVTKEGLAALNEELKDLEVARAQAGDDYLTANYIDAKIKLLIGRIASAVEVDLSKAKKDTVSFGAWVRYNGRVVRIVGVDEADVDHGLVSFVSPLAKALTGKQAGAVVALGTERITVEEVSYEPLALTQWVRDKNPEATAAPERKNPSPLPKKNVELAKTPQDVQNEAVAPSPKEDGARHFEPEVDAMAFLPIVNERGILVGRALYVEIHQGNKILHPVVHLHVLNGKGETTGLYWWHVAFGDTPEKTLLRKMKETLGLTGVKPMLKRQYIRETKTEKELVYVFTAVSAADLPKAPAGKDYLELFAKDLS